jgi:hypothetical protein
MDNPFLYMSPEGTYYTGSLAYEQKLLHGASRGVLRRSAQRAGISFGGEVMLVPVFADRDCALQSEEARGTEQMPASEEPTFDELLHGGVEQ